MSLRQLFDQIVITTIVTNPVVRYEQRKDQSCDYDNTNPVVRYDQIVITTIVTNPVVRYEQLLQKKGSDCDYDNCYKPSDKI